MKIRFTHLLALSLTIVVSYTACKKMATTSPANTTAIDYKSISSTVAMNLTASIYGKNGGNNISNGLQTVFSLGSSHKGLTLYSNSSAPSCGSIFDTTYTDHYTKGDTAKTFENRLKYIYTCNGGNSLNGYTVHDSITNIEINPKFYYQFITTQNYTVVATDITFKKVTMNGGIYNAFTEKLLKGTTQTGYHNLFAFYNLSGLLVDFTSGSADITTGIATFTMNKADLDPSGLLPASAYTLTGTIQYLGNHTAKLTIANPFHVYLVNLITGVATEQ